MQTPPEFRLWSAIGAVSGALERRCWTQTWDPIYPNLMILLVAQPGVGKSNVINLVRALWKEIPTLSVAPSTITKAALVDQMHDNPSAYEIDGETLLCHPCLVSASEFGNFLGEYDLEFVNVLNELYDCGPAFGERTRYKGSIAFERPHIMLLGGTHPKGLSMSLPDAAFGMGLVSRLMMIYGEGDPPLKIWHTEHENLTEKAVRLLLPDLAKIAEMTGRFHWTARAKRLVEQWNAEGQPPRPKHPRLEHYASRRLAHVLKLSMVFGAARGADLEVNRSDVVRAMRCMFEAELRMPEALMAMGANTQTVLNDLAVYVTTSLSERKGRPIPESNLWDYLSMRLPSSQIKSVIETALRVELIKLEPSAFARTKTRLYIPGSKTPLFNSPEGWATLSEEEETPDAGTQL